MQQRTGIQAAQQRLLEQTDLDVVSRRVEMTSGSAVHILEVGDGDPLLLVHGGGTSSAQMLPLMAQLEGRRLIAIDRPGYGLSDAVTYRPADFRQVAVTTIVDLLDALELDQVDYLGNSMGSVWGTWVCSDQPERIQRMIHAGSTPLMPGFSVPFPLRLMATPVLGEFMMRMMPANESSVRRMMANFGEGDTIGDHPGQIDTVVAMYDDPEVSRAMLEETRAITRGPVLRRQYLFDTDDLQEIEQPTLLLWGEDDPVAGLDVARTMVRSMPDARLEILPTGHMPWLGEPERVAALVTDFLEQ